MSWLRENYKALIAPVFIPAAALTVYFTIPLENVSSEGRTKKNQPNIEERVDLDKQYPPEQAVWAWYGQMHVDIGIQKVVCSEDSKHYDKEMCDKAGEDLLYHTQGYLNSMRRLEEKRDGLTPRLIR